MATATNRTSVHRHTDVNLEKGHAWPIPGEALVAGTIQGDKLVLLYSAVSMGKTIRTRTRVVTCKRDESDRTLWRFDSQLITGSL